MSDLRHAIGRHMPIRDFRDVLLIPYNQLRKRVDLAVQYPPDNLKIIGHQSLHSNEVEALRRHVPRHCIIPLICDVSPPDREKYSWRRHATLGLTGL